MTERDKKTKMEQYLKDNKKSLDSFARVKGEKYVREPWMLKANPAAEHSQEIEVEDDQGGN